MAKRCLFLLLLVFLFSPVALAQQFYRWRDGKGQWNFSDNRPVEVMADNVKTIFYPPTPLSTRDPFNSGYREGYSLGYEQGYREYYKRRYEQGRQQGYKEGYKDWKLDK